MPETGIPLSVWSGSGATDELRNTIIAFNAVATRQAATMIYLTWAIVCLTVVMVFEVAWQIWKVS
jgi:hypothetical protein